MLSAVPKFTSSIPIEGVEKFEHIQKLTETNLEKFVVICETPHGDVVLLEDRNFKTSKD